MRTWPKPVQKPKPPVIVGGAWARVRPPRRRQPRLHPGAQCGLRCRIIPVPGGVLIRDQAGEIIGVVGISGDISENDETCAVYGIECAGLVADTGDPG
jgi:uncharacterized protein GlcG (DUF336 family)